MRKFVKSVALTGLAYLASLGSPTTGIAAVLETLNYARFYSATSPNVFYACANTNGVDCSGSVVAPGTDWTVNYFARSAAAFGLMRDQASVLLTGDNSLGPFPSFESTGARSGYRDTYTIAGGTGTGTIDFTFTVSGSATSTGGASAGDLFQYVPVVSGEEDFGSQVNYPVSNGTATVAVPFTFGQPTELTIYFYALAQVFAWQEGSSAAAGYFDTALLDHIVVLDSQNNVVPNFNIVAESGTFYGPDGVAPEPATLALLAVGCAAIGFVTQRSRIPVRTARRSWAIRGAS